MLQFGFLKTPHNYVREVTNVLCEKYWAKFLMHNLLADDGQMPYTQAFKRIMASGGRLLGKCQWKVALKTSLPWISIFHQSRVMWSWTLINRLSEPNARWSWIFVQARNHISHPCKSKLGDKMKISFSMIDGSSFYVSFCQSDFSSVHIHWYWLYHSA